MVNVGVIGAGYVGLVTATCLAELGHKVLCVDNDPKKLAKLKKGISPIYEPGLDELIVKNMKAKRLVFGPSIKDAAQHAEVIFICVNTPPLPDGGADLSMVERVASEIAKVMKGYKVIVGKSTVPAETHEKIKRTISMITKGKGDFDVASNPEFLREGHAVGDTLHPDRIVVGVESIRAEKLMRALYKTIKAPLLVTNITTAEIIKHACNSFLSTKISYINAIAQICERVNADVEMVADAMGLDKRIGRQFLNAGPGFGGNCFPKDLDAFIHLAEKKGYNFELLKAVRKINYDQKKVVMKKVEEALWIIKGKTIGVLGLSFKALTDDVRNSVAVDIVNMLQQEKAQVKAYDPQAMEKAKSELPGVKLCRNAYEVCRNSDCLVVLTEWEEFKKLDLKKVKKLLRQPVIVDARNLFDPAKVRELGFVYKCIGRGS